MEDAFITTLVHVHPEILLVLRKVGGKVFCVQEIRLKYVPKLCEVYSPALHTIPGTVNVTRRYSRYDSPVLHILDGSMVVAHCSLTQFECQLWR